MAPTLVTGFSQCESRLVVLSANKRGRRPNRIDCLSFVVRHVGR